MKLQELKGKYTGRIFLLGSGASLNLVTEEEKAALSREFVFTGSRYARWQKAMPYDFYVVAEQTHCMNWQEMGISPQPRIAKFWVEWQPAPSGWVTVPRPDSLSYHHFTLPEWGFSPFEGECNHIHMGHDVPIAMLQLARYIGFDEFYLLGCETTAQGYAWDAAERRSVGNRAGKMPGLYAKARDLLQGKLYDCTPNGNLHKVLEHKPLLEVLGAAIA